MTDDEAQQLKGCAARKALQRMMDEHGHDCDCIPMVLCEYCESRAALSAPCPCEEGGDNEQRLEAELAERLLREALSWIRENAARAISAPPMLRAIVQKADDALASPEGTK